MFCTKGMIHATVNNCLTNISIGLALITKMLAHHSITHVKSCFSSMFGVNYLDRFGDNYDGRLSIADELRLFLVFSPVTVAIDLKDRGMVNNSVDGGHSHNA